MIRLYAEIEIDKDAKINNAELATSELPNNVSCDIGDIINKTGETTKVIQNPFIIGKTKFKDNGTLCPDKVDYFICKSGYNYRIRITSNTLGMTAIVFDDQNNVYPLSASISTNISYGIRDNNSSIFWFVSPDNSNTVDIIIFNWNNNNAPHIIKGIYAASSCAINHRNLISCSTTFSDRENVDTPSYGIASNNTSIEFVDYNNLFYALVLNSMCWGCSIKLFIENNLTKRKQQIFDGIIIDVDYDEYNNIFSLDFSDNLKSLQDINLDYKHMKISETLDLLTLANSFLNSAGYTIRDTQNLLSNVKYTNTQLPSESLWSRITKVAEATGAHLYCLPSDRKTLVASFEDIL